ncbi:MAG: hypothetical protein SV760_00680, partial [Halobacteria archaeon]|nr:hypothetical protein [Halobacteria archaeon]
ALKSEIETYNERVSEANDEIEAQDLDVEEYEELPDGVLELPMMVTANVTRGEQAQHHSKLYETLKAVDLVDPDAN